MLAHHHAIPFGSEVEEPLYTFFSVWLLKGHLNLEQTDGELKHTLSSTILQLQLL